MTELTEIIAVLLQEDITHKKETCYFCQAEKAQPAELVVKDDEDEDSDNIIDAKSEYKFHNKAKTLGNNVGGDSDDRKVVVKGLTFVARVAAHHLIPGNASLQPSLLYGQKKFLRTEGMKQGNIGYDINCKENGIWAPGNYGERPWGDDGVDFESNPKNKVAGVTCEIFAFAAIRKWKTQFHDAHPDYSRVVESSLNSLNKKLIELQSGKCPSNNNHDDDKLALTATIGRLNIMSSQLRRFVELADINQWKDPMYLSRFSKSFHTKHPQG